MNFNGLLIGSENPEPLAAFYEKLKPGMARFLNEAIHANAVARS